MRKLLLGLAALALIPLWYNAWATTDLTKLGSPDVTITPTSGPPGTKITITVSHIPDISKETYPYPDLYLYLPFSKPFGATVSSHCGGQDCFPIYVHAESLTGDSTDKTITFSLPSINNPKPVILNGLENSICDATVNGKTALRYSTLCNSNNEPEGTYEIMLVWAIESDLEQSLIIKTVPFTVTPAVMQSPSSVADNGNLILKEYENGTISQGQFFSKLKAKGWTDEQIRQALAVIGKLPHQMGVFGPDTVLPINAVNSTNHTAVNITNTSPTSTITPIVNTANNTEKKQENNSMSLPLHNSSSVQPEKNTSKSTPEPNQSTIQSVQNTSTWNGIIIGLVIAAITMMAVVVIIVKVKKKR